MVPPLGLVGGAARGGSQPAREAAGREYSGTARLPIQIETGWLEGEKSPTQRGLPNSPTHKKLRLPLEQRIFSQILRFYF